MQKHRPPSRIATHGVQRRPLHPDHPGTNELLGSTVRCPLVIHQRTLIHRGDDGIEEAIDFLPVGVMTFLLMESGFCRPNYFEGVAGAAEVGDLETTPPPVPNREEPEFCFRKESRTAGDDHP